MEHQHSLIELIAEARSLGFTQDVEYNAGKYFYYGKELAPAKVEHSREWYCPYNDTRVLLEGITAGSVQGLVLIF